MDLLQIVFHIAGLVLLVLAACNVSGRINTTAAGLACWLFASAVVPLFG